MYVCMYAYWLLRVSPVCVCALPVFLYIVIIFKARPAPL